MKQNVTTITLVIVASAIILGLFGLSTAFAGSRGVNLISPRVDVAATAQIIQFQNKQAQLEQAFEQRLEALRSQISQTQQALDDLNRSVEAQTSTYNNQLTVLQEQVAQKQGTVQRLQANLISLKQDIITDEEQFDAEMAVLKGEMEQAEAGLLAELQSVNQQLQAAQVTLDASSISPPSPELADDPATLSPAGDDDHDDEDKSDDDSKDEDKEDEKHEDSKREVDDDDHDDDDKEADEDKKEDKKVGDD